MFKIAGTLLKRNLLRLAISEKPEAYLTRIHILKFSNIQLPAIIICKIKRVLVIHNRKRKH